MARIFSENENRDIFLNSDNKISISENLAAVQQAAKSSVEIQLGEAIYAVQNGVPTEKTVWSGTPNLQQFEFFARRQILSVDGVIEVSEFNASISGDVLNYQATIKTIHGEGSFNGSI